jgi:hypothetical protein
MKDTTKAIIEKIKNDRKDDKRVAHLCFKVSGDWAYSEAPAALGYKIYLLTDPEHDDDCRIAIPLNKRLPASERDALAQRILDSIGEGAEYYTPTNPKDIVAKSIIKFCEKLPLLDVEGPQLSDPIGYDLDLETEFEQEKIKYISARLKLVAGTTNVIYGAPGSGKTTLLMAFGMHFARAKEFLGLDTTGGNVLHLDWEMPELLSRNSYRRLRFGYELDQKPGSYTYFPKTILPFRLDDEDAEDILTELIKANDAKLVFIDSLKRSIGASIDENDARIAQLVFDPLARVSDATGATFVVIHHANKVGSTYRGSSAIEGEVSSLYRVDQDKENENYTLSQEKSRAGKNMQKLMFTFIDTGSKIDENFCEGLIISRILETPEEGIDTKILRTLINGGLSSTDLCDAVGGSNGGRYVKTRDKMLEDGLLLNSMAGKATIWKLSPSGEQEASKQNITATQKDLAPTTAAAADDNTTITEENENV